MHPHPFLILKITVNNWTTVEAFEKGVRECLKQTSGRDWIIEIKTLNEGRKFEKLINI